jgi:hypothetical protein
MAYEHEQVGKGLLQQCSDACTLQHHFVDEKGGAGNTMSNPNACEEGVEFFVLTTPIYLHGYNFLVKGVFNKTFEGMKDLKTSYL